MKKILFLILLLTVQLDAFATDSALMKEIDNLKVPGTSKEDCNNKSDYVFKLFTDIGRGKSMYNIQKQYPGIPLETIQKLSTIYKMINSPMFELMLMMSGENLSSKEITEMQAMKTMMEPSTIRDVIYTSCVKDLNVKLSINEVYSVSSKSLNVRNKPGMKGEVIARLKQGDKVKVLAQSNRWVEISSDSIKVSPSWVYSKYLSKVDNN